MANPFMVLLPFDADESEIDQAIGETQLWMSNHGVELPPDEYWNAIVKHSYQGSLNDQISMVVWTTMHVDILYCYVCSNPGQYIHIYAYIRELARSIGIQVISISN